LIRVLFESMRPFTICVLEPNGERVLMLNRPFRFYFHKVDILDPNRNMKYLGTIQRRFSILRRKYSVLDDKKVEIFQLSSPILDPLTFVIRMGGRDVGEITKKWSGLLEELFTTADNFGIVFPPETDLIKKSLLLGAVFLIDFVYFESGE